MIKKPSRKTATLRKPSIPTASLAPPAPAKRYEIKSYADIKRGEKIIVYGDTGIGKTSLALLAPKPVFLDLDEGGFELRHPVTGKKLDHVPDIRNFADVRDALQQVDLFDNIFTMSD